MLYVAVFVIAAAIDFVYAVFLRHQNAGNVARAVGYGGLLSILGWISVWAFLDNYWMAIPEILGTCVGIGFGTYLNKKSWHEN